jgi:hypothetical protein
MPIEAWTDLVGWMNGAQRTTSVRVPTLYAFRGVWRATARPRSSHIQYSCWSTITALHGLHRRHRTLAPAPLHLAVQPPAVLPLLLWVPIFSPHALLFSRRLRSTPRLRDKGRFYELGFAGGGRVWCCREWGRSGSRWCPSRRGFLPLSVGVRNWVLRFSIFLIFFLCFEGNSVLYVTLLLVVKTFRILSLRWRLILLSGGFEVVWKGFEGTWNFGGNRDGIWLAKLADLRWMGF